MSPREQFTAARRYLRTEPSLFSPMPAQIPAELWEAAKATMFKSERKGFGPSPVVEWKRLSPRVSYGCKCDSCTITNRYARAGFAKWPSDAPKGAMASAKEYKAHAKHCGSAGLPKPWRYVSRPPQFNTAGLTMPIPQAPRMVLDYIATMKLPADWRKPKPKRTPYLVALARDLRKAA